MRLVVFLGEPWSFWTFTRRLGYLNHWRGAVTIIHALHLCWPQVALMREHLLGCTFRGYCGLRDGGGVRLGNWIGERVQGNRDEIRLLIQIQGNSGLAVVHVACLTGQIHWNSQLAAVSNRSCYRNLEIEAESEITAEVWIFVAPLETVICLSRAWEIPIRNLERSEQSVGICVLFPIDILHLKSKHLKLWVVGLLQALLTAPFLPLHRRLCRRNSRNFVATAHKPIRCAKTTLHRLVLRIILSLLALWWAWKVVRRM